MPETSPDVPANESTTPRKAVVLGACGFLGRAVVGALTSQGHEVVGVARRWPADAPTCSRRVSGDISDEAVLDDAFQSADIVFHLASSTHPTLNLDDPIREIASCLLPLQSLLESARRNQVQKIVYPSSGGTVYADQAEARTESTLTDPRTPYAICKLAAEQILLTAAQRTGDFSVDVMRIANVYGPGQPRRPGQGVLPHWIHALRLGQPIVIFGDGTASRDYVHVEDVARCLISCCDRDNTSSIFNVGTGVATSLNDLARLISAPIGHTPTIEYRDARAADLECVSLDSTKLQKLVGGLTWRTLDEGLATILPNELRTTHSGVDGAVLLDQERLQRGQKLED